MKRIILGLCLFLTNISFSEAKAFVEPKKEANFEIANSSFPRKESADVNKETVDPAFFQGTICTFYVGEPYVVEGFAGFEEWRDIELSCWSCSFCPGDVTNVIYR